MINFKDLIAESSLSRIRQKVDTHDSGAITAFRGEFNKSANKTRNQALLAYLLKEGYSVTKVKGSYIENYGSKDEVERGEESFFVTDQHDKGNLKEVLEKLGSLYDQDSILWIPKGTKGQLIGTSKRDNAFPSYKQTMDFSKSEFGKVGGAFFSRIRGRQFTFTEGTKLESFADILYPTNINGIRSLSILAESVEKQLTDID